MTETRASYTIGLTEWVFGLQGPQPQPEVVHVNGVEYRRARQCGECRHWYCPDGRTHGTCAEFSKKRVPFVTGQEFYCKHWETRPAKG